MRLRRPYRAMRRWLVLALTLLAAATTVAPAVANTAVGVRRAATIPSAAARPAPAAPPAPAADLVPGAASAVLMDAASGEVLWQKNAHARRPIASITKLMTMDLVLDAIQQGKIRWNDLVTAGEDAWKTQGSQIWLELGEMMTVRQLFTAVAVSSANDAAVALADYVGGDSAGFVEMMNEKARALGMKDTHYVNPHGLDAEGHYSSAYDIALVSRDLLLRHPEVLQFSSLFQTRLRENVPGKTSLWLVNTNKTCLSTYPGCDGLKTGWTSSAGYGVSDTAKRGSTRLIAVVLGEPSAKQRDAEAAALLNDGFARFATVIVAPARRPVAQLSVDLGTRRTVPVGPTVDAALTVPRGQEKTVARVLELPQRLPAPVGAGQSVGQVVITQGGRPVARFPLVTLDASPRIGIGRLFLRLWRLTWPW